MNPQSWLKEHTVYLVTAGSHSYGTNIETSDVDVRGVCIPPKPYFLGFDRFDQSNDKTLALQYPDVRG